MRHALAKMLHIATDTSGLIDDTVA